MRAALVLNEHSGRYRAAHDLPAAIAGRGIDLVHVACVDNEVALRRAIKRVRKRVDCVIVGGGDGSMATAVDVLAKRKTVLGVLPLGTGNSFARSLGFDDDLEAALDALAAPRVERVDLGRVNGSYFANFATIGLSAEIASNAPRRLKRIVGAAAYAIGGIVPFVKRRPFRAKLAWDNGRERLETTQMVVASGRFFGHRPIAPDATITDHRLAFFATTGVSHLDIARTYVALGLGIGDHLPDAVTFATKALIVKTKPRQPISIDGNAFGKTPARFRVAPAALRVLVGPGFDAVNR